MYATCNGWQETLARFFVKKRRSNVIQLLSHNISSSCGNDQNLNSTRLWSDCENVNNDSINLTSTSTFNILTSSEKSSSDDDIANRLQINDAIIDLDLSQTHETNSFISNPLDPSTHKDSNIEFQECSDNIIMVPSRSISPNEENLCSLIQMTNPINNNNNEIIENNDDNLSSLLSGTTINTSMLPNSFRLRKKIIMSITDGPK